MRISFARPFAAPTRRSGTVGILPALVLLGLALVAPDARADAPAAPARMETLAGAGFTHGGFGGPTATGTVLLDRPALLVGGRGGWIVNHTFVLGGAVHGLLPIGSTFEAPTGPRELRLSYGGLWLEWLFAPESFIHGSLGVLVGAGWTETRRVGSVDPDTVRALWAVEPTATVELNVTEFLRVGLAASWRQLGGTSEPGLTDAKLSGPAATLLLKFGAF